MKITAIDGIIVLLADAMKFRGIEYPIKSVESDSDFDQILAQYNTFIPNSLVNKIPIYDLESNIATGVYSSTETQEVLKLRIPGNVATVELLREGNTTMIIRFDTSEIYHDKVVVLSNKKEAPSPDEDEANSCKSLHLEVNAPNGRAGYSHLDSLLSVNLGHSKLQTDKSIYQKIPLESRVLNGTLIDASGRFYFVGNPYDE